MTTEVVRVCHAIHPPATMASATALKMANRVFFISKKEIVKVPEAGIIICYMQAARIAAIAELQGAIGDPQSDLNGFVEVDRIDSPSY